MVNLSAHISHTSLLSNLEPTLSPIMLPIAVHVYHDMRECPFWFILIDPTILYPCSLDSLLVKPFCCKKILRSK